MLHLNGYKIANPTVLARIPAGELAELMRGYGYTRHFVAAAISCLCTSSPPPRWIPCSTTSRRSRTRHGGHGRRAIGQPGR